MAARRSNEFWKRVTPTETGCWLYAGAPVAGGYVQCEVQKKRIYVHRLMYELVHGPIQPSMEVCHTCDVPNCVSPWHLFLGTHDDNMLDAAKKGRKDKKLDANSAKRIRELIAAGVGDQGIAASFGVSRQTVNDIRHGKNRSYLGA